MSAPLSIIIPPTGPEPITLDEVRALCRIDEDVEAENLYLQNLILAARLRIEKDTGRKLLPQTAATSRYYWPRERYLTIPTLPVNEVIAVTFHTVNGPMPLAASRYALFIHENQYATVNLIDGEPWPAVTMVFPGITTTFRCGYNSVPEDLLQAMRSLISYWYDNREAAIASTEYKADSAYLPLQYKDLIYHYVLPRL